MVKPVDAAFTSPSKVFAIGENRPVEPVWVGVEVKVEAGTSDSMYERSCVGADARLFNCADVSVGMREAKFWFTRFVIWVGVSCERKDVG